jgi:hypothetical protein
MIYKIIIIILLLIIINQHDINIWSTINNISKSLVTLSKLNKTEIIAKFYDNFTN